MITSSSVKKCYPVVEVQCDQCTTFFVKERKELARCRRKGSKVFCSRKCFFVSITKLSKRTCLRCHIDFKPTSIKQTFCSKSCANGNNASKRIGQKNPSYVDGRSGYRQRALEHYGKVCQHCGYSDDERMLDVDHINSNRRHNRLENLQVLCVWCHALKTRKIGSYICELEVDTE